MSVLVLAAALVAGLLLLRRPGREIAAILLAIWMAVIAVHLLLPEGHALRRAAGGDARAWALPGLLAALAWAYAAGLARVRRKASDRTPAPAATAAPGPLAPAELARYARHIVLRELGGPGQRRLKAARVLVVGAGGLGSPALLYLAAAGVGRVGIIDDDRVSLSNLQRQIIHGEADVDRPKVESARDALRRLNPFVAVEIHAERLSDEARAADLLAAYDLVLDGSDNFETRYLVNAACVRAGKPLVAAAIAQWEGQLSVYDSASGGPCFRCVFPEAPAEGLAPACAEAGVVAPLPGILGAMMALEAIKHLTGAGRTLAGSLLIYDGLWGETRRVAIVRRADCPTCGAARPGTLA